ncbi:MAG: phospholipase D-like domain-containing protein [Bacteriovoracaceae bacterium]|nr:phospholipase D-like domain-containing protein [Bacteriovoracaceae bacterium]
MIPSEIIYHAGDLYFEDLFKALESATKSIYLEVYIFELDSIGTKAIEILEKISKKGVEVKILLDGFGCTNWNDSLAQKYRSKQLQINFFHPLPWQRSRESLWRSLGLRKIVTGILKFQRRNHKKVVIIDDKILFIGSRNITQMHSFKFNGSHEWRDISVQVRGETKSNQIQIDSHLADFKYTWEFPHQYFGKRWGEVRKIKQLEHHLIIEKILNAQKRVWITNPYFVPDIKLLAAIRNSSRAGVDIKILLPKNINIYFFKYAVESLYGLLLACKVEIYEYLPSMLHAKILIIDDWVSVGSYNLDYRSIYFNLESSITIQSRENIKSLEDQFMKDISVSRKIDQNRWKKRSRFNRFFEKLFFLFRPIL